MLFCTNLLRVGGEGGGDRLVLVVAKVFAYLGGVQRLLVLPQEGGNGLRGALHRAGRQQGVHALHRIPAYAFQMCLVRGESGVSFMLVCLGMDGFAPLAFTAPLPIFSCTAPSDIFGRSVKYG